MVKQALAALDSRSAADLARRVLRAASAGAVHALLEPLAEALAQRRAGAAAVYAKET